MSETKTLTAAGLWTNPNELTGRPAGALTEADNVEIPQPGVLRPVRGQGFRPEELLDDSDARLSSGTTYGGFDFEHTTADVLERVQLFGDGYGHGISNTVEAVEDESGAQASVQAPSGARVRFAPSAGDLYVTTSTGPMVLDGAEAALAVPGAPRALDAYISVPANGGVGEVVGGTGYLDAGYNAAYRVVIGQNDAEGKPQLGAPSGRFFASNPTYVASLTRSGTAVTVSLQYVPKLGLFGAAPSVGDHIAVTPTDTNNPGSPIKIVTGGVGFTITYTETGPSVTGATGYTVSMLRRPVQLALVLPPGLIEGKHFIQLYRTSEVPIGTDPGDDMRLIAERPLTGTEIGNGTVSMTDITPDVSRGAPLYTNALQEGLSQANERAPLVADLSEFRQSLIGVDVTRPHRLVLSLIGLPSDGDVFTLAGLTYTVNNSGTNNTSGAFDLEDDEDLTVSQHLERTARNFVRAINTRSGNTSVRAYYISGVDDPPGKIAIEAVGVGGSAFTISVSAHGSLYVPDISAAVTSVAERIPNGVIMSKQGLPYAFPPASQYLLRIGAADKPNVRGISLRDSFWIFKSAGGAGGGIWKLTGSGPGAFYPENVTESVYLVAPESAVVVDNTIYGLSNKGVIAVSEAGVEILSVPIEDQLKELLIIPEMVAKLRQLAVGVSYEHGTETKYLLFLPTSTTSTFAERGYSFNATSEIQAWTRRVEDLGEATGAYVNALGRLVVGSPFSNKVLLERKAGTRSDFRGQNTFTIHLTYVASGVRFEADDNSAARVGYTFEDDTGVAQARIVAVGDHEAGENWIDVDDGDALRALFTDGDQDFTITDAIPIRFGWTVDSDSHPNYLKDFQEQTLQFGEAHSEPWIFEWRTDLGGFATLNGYPEGRKYLHQWVDEGVATCTRLNTAWYYSVGAENLSILGFTTQMIVYPDASSEM